MNCYQYEIYHNKNYIFDNVDATYVLTMENSPRLENVKKQLSEYFLTKTTYIQHNKGFKKCNKTLPPNRKVNVSYLDLSHAYLQAFRHAQIHNFKNILVLEDDFIISPEITNRTYIREINKFIHYINKTGGLIQLGTLPHITIKHNEFFRKCIVSSGTHANIYSQQYINHTINTAHTIEDFDCYVNNDGNNYRFCFYKPLVYQIYEQTENRNHWGQQYGGIVRKIMVPATNLVFYLTNIDKTPEPGTSWLYKNQVFMYDFATPLIIALLLSYGAYINNTTVKI